MKKQTETRKQFRIKDGKIYEKFKRVIKARGFTLAGWLDQAMRREIDK